MQEEVTATSVSSCARASFFCNAVSSILSLRLCAFHEPVPAQTQFRDRKLIVQVNVRRRKSGSPLKI